MDEPLRHHPFPAPRLPEGLSPDSDDSVRRFAHSHRFPSAENGRFLFAFMDEEARYETVLLRHGLAGHREPPSLYRCVNGLHLLHLHAQSVHRVEYRFELVDRIGQSTLISDPLNPHTVRDPFAIKSVIATSEYRAPAYTVENPETPRGSLRELMLAGPLGNPWPTWIWTSANLSPHLHSDATRLPLVLFLDGGDWLQLNHADTILNNLIAQRRIAPCRAVFVKPATRNEEYAANPRTADYLADELWRMLNEFIPVPHESRKRFAVGCSLGGLCLLHSHFAHPGNFGGLILQSGSFFQPQTDAMESGFEYFPKITAFVSRALGQAGREIARIPIHMTAGMGEENDVNNHVMAAALTRQGFPLTFHEQPDAHNWTCWRDCIGGGLMRLLPNI